MSELVVIVKGHEHRVPRPEIVSICDLRPGELTQEQADELNEKWMTAVRGAARIAEARP